MVILYSLELRFEKGEPDPGTKALILGKLLDDAWNEFLAKHGDGVDVEESGWVEHPWHS